MQHLLYILQWDDNQYFTMHMKVHAAAAACMVSKHYNKPVIHDAASIVHTTMG